MSRPLKKAGTLIAFRARSAADQNSIDLVKLRDQLEALQDRADLTDAKIDQNDTRFDDHENRIESLEGA